MLHAIVLSASLAAGSLSCPPDCQFEDTCCRLDIDCSGQVDGNDFDLFLFGFFSPDGVPDWYADFNRDGFVNPDDLSDFITAFFMVQETTECER